MKRARASNVRPGPAVPPATSTADVLPQPASLVQRLTAAEAMDLFALEPPLALRPHNAHPFVEPLPPRRRSSIPLPTILLSYEAYCDTLFVIAESGIFEIAWYGAVRELPKDRYLIESIQVVPQCVRVDHCEVDAARFGRQVHALLKQDPTNREFFNRLRFLGHLHPVGTTPSREDETQGPLFAENPYFIRGIFSRQGGAHFTFYDNRRQAVIDDCPWGLALDEGRQPAIREAVRENVIVEHPFVLISGGTSDGSSRPNQAGERAAGTRPRPSAANDRRARS